MAALLRLLPAMLLLVMAAVSAMPAASAGPLPWDVCLYRDGDPHELGWDDNGGVLVWTPVPSFVLHGGTWYVGVAQGECPQP